jgi:hypothetical protein
VEPGYLLLEHDEAWMYLKRFAGPAVDASAQTLKPSGASIMDRQISGDSHIGELR